MSVTWPRGFRAAAVIAGIKPSGRPDLALIVRDDASGTGGGLGGAHAVGAAVGAAGVAGAVGAAVHAPGVGCAMVFTRNNLVGAPVVVGRRLRAGLMDGTGRVPRAILINAGNSNAATGERGVRDALSCCAAAAGLIGCTQQEVVPCSTGVIGRLLAVENIERALPGLVGLLSAGESADAAAGGAIMTTDRVPKAARREVAIDGMTVRIGAIAKGAGMIAPRLDSAKGMPTPSATMLAFVTTDAPIDSVTMQAALEAAMDETFNRISVDNHASCSDTVLCLSSGLAATKATAAASTTAKPTGVAASADAGSRGPNIVAGTKAYAAFAAALKDVCADLAMQIVQDGEGATRVFEVNVTGAPDNAAADRIASEVVNSPLVKCAVHGRDPNWGRIVTAAGNAGIAFDVATCALSIGPVEVFRGGQPMAEALNDPRLKDAMGAKMVVFALRVGNGVGKGRMTGCDLTAEYVSINAEYTT